MLTLTKQEILEAALNADIDEDNVRFDYSGRAMYGETCFGITGDNSEIIKFMLYLVEAGVGAHSVVTLSERMRTDNMGLDTIFYFPGIDVEDEDDYEASV